MGKVTKQPTPQKSSITLRLRTDLGRSVGVTTATQLVWKFIFKCLFVFPLIAQPLWPVGRLGPYILG